MPKKSASPKKPAPKPKRIKGRVGDVVAIPLGDARYAFAHVQENCGLRVFRYTSKSIADVATIVRKPILLHCHFFSVAIEDGLWPILGNVPFADADDAWPPPMWHLDEMSGRYEIRHYHPRKRETSRPATKAQIKGLELHVMHFPKDLVARIKRSLRSR